MTSQDTPPCQRSGHATAATGRDWAYEPERIAFTYAPWNIGKRTTGPGWIARRAFHDGAIISIEAPDLIILESRLLDHREQERRIHTDPLAWPSAPPGIAHTHTGTT